MTLPVTLIVSHEPLLRLGLITYLTTELLVRQCFQAANLIEALPLLETHSPGLIIVAACAMAEDTPRLLRELSHGRKAPPMVVVSHAPQPEYVRRVLNAGALAVVTNADTLDELEHAIHACLRGGMHISPKAAGSMLIALTGEHEDTDEASLRVLSDREMEIFDLVGRGMSGKDIASHLSISIKTVETHKHRIKEKLHFPHATQLVRAAANHALRAPQPARRPNHR